MPRFFDLFAHMKRSAVGGLQELRKMFVCFGYIYAVDINHCVQGGKWQDIVKHATCTPLGVQVQCYSGASGGGFARKSVENWSAKGRVSASDGLPIVGVPLSTSDEMRVRRIKGASSLQPQRTCSGVPISKISRVLVCLADFAEFERVLSLGWINQMRQLLPAHSLFSSLLEETLLPPATSVGLMPVLRALSAEPCSIPGQFIVMQALKGYAQHIRAEADCMGPALSQEMCDGFYQKFNVKVERTLYMAVLHFNVLGFPTEQSEDALASLKVECSQLCPT